MEPGSPHRPKEVPTDANIQNAAGDDGCGSARHGRRRGWDRGRLGGHDELNDDARNHIDDANDNGADGPVSDTESAASEIGHENALPEHGRLEWPLGLQLGVCLRWPGARRELPVIGRAG